MSPVIPEADTHIQSFVYTSGISVVYHFHYIELYVNGVYQEIMRVYGAEYYEHVVHWQ